MNFLKLSMIGFLMASSSFIYANNNKQLPVSPQFAQYALNLYNYTVNNMCYMDDIQTRDSSLKKSGKVIYWYNGKKREIVDAMVFRIQSSQGVIAVFELNGQVSGTYRCLKGKNFQSRYMFESRLLRKLDKHTQKKIKDALIKQKKL